MYTYPQVPVKVPYELKSIASEFVDPTMESGNTIVNVLSYTLINAVYGAANPLLCVTVNTPATRSALVNVPLVALADPAPLYPDAPEYPDNPVPEYPL